MAAAIVTAVENPAPMGNLRLGVFTFTFSTSYPSGGEPMTASLFGMQRIIAVVPLGSPRASAAVIPVYDAPNNQLALYTATTGAVVTGDQSSNVIRLLVIGI